MEVVWIIVTVASGLIQLQRRNRGRENPMFKALGRNEIGDLDTRTSRCRARR